MRGQRFDIESCEMDEESGDMVCEFSDLPEPEDKTIPERDIDAYKPDNLRQRNAARPPENSEVV